VTVTAEQPLVETTSNVLGGTVTAAEIQSLPVNGRDFTKLLVLVPGATGDPSGATDSPGSFGLFSANGNRGRSNNYLLDGTDMNDGYRNLPAINEAGVFGTPATILPLDALAEIPVMNMVEAEYGRNAGAIVNIVTKSGTNTWHGSAYGYFRSDAFDARNYFNTADQPQNSFSNKQFGGSLGGPIVKDKTFFFTSYEGQREEGSLSSLATVPSQAQVAFYGGPTNPVIAALLAMDPWGTLPATGADNCVGLEDPLAGTCSANITSPIPFENRVDSLIFKIDQHLGKHLLTGRYFFGDSDQLFPLALQMGGSAGPVPGYNTVTPTTVHVLSLSYTHVWTPRLLMEIRGGWNRFNEDFLPEDQAFDPNSIGLATVSDPRDFGLPLMRVSGFSPLGANGSTPRGRIDQNYQLNGNFAYSTGRHNWKWGYEWRRTTIEQFFDAGYRGVLAFGALPDFLSGTITSFSRQARGDSLRNTHQNNHAFYFQDSWKLHPRFTLNYGLRWDYYGVIGEDNDLWSIIDPSVPGGGLMPTSELYPKDLNNFAPRLSFAWDLFGSGKTVVRAGWGVYYDAFSHDFFIGQLPWNSFNPGPAYNNAGASPVQFAFIFGGDNPVIAPGANPFEDPLAPNPTFYCPVYFPCDVFTVDQNIRTPYVQNFNLNIEQQLGPNVALQVSYAGSAGRKLFRYRDINQAIYDPIGDSQTFPFPNFGYTNSFESTASSSYNGLQVSLAVQNWHGLNSRVNYTWSHSIDNASDGQDYVVNATQPDNSFNPGRERANSNFDTRHRFVWYSTYEFPKTQTMPWLLSGWAIDGVVTLASGQPYNVNWLFEDDYNGTFEFFGRPDVVGDPYAGTGGLNLLNLGAFAVPCTYDNVTGTCFVDGLGNGDRHFGNLGRNAFVGPNYHNFDFSVVKNTKLGERANLQLRVDFFNVLNHPNFANPVLPNFGIDFLANGGTFVDTGTLGDNIGELRGTGFLQPTATPDVGIGNPFLGGGGSRNIQFGVKLSF
ncbi:MAG TPA: hypothetical protein VLA96_09200, partial [Terriglobales bacterium]|nr:hypothetical protein [Terriglobales bacterium]